MRRIVEIGKWERYEDFSFDPKGSKPKQTVLCPDPAPNEGLLAGHLYLFKIAVEGWKGQQMWSELIAAEIGALVGVPVPPCHLAMDHQTDQIGALVEFFYRYPG